MALAVADGTTAQLLADAGATTTDLRHTLVLALLERNEPACEVLAQFGVDVDALTEATRRELMTLTRA